MPINARSKIILIIVVAVVGFFIYKFFFKQEEFCPSDKCTFSLDSPPDSFKAMQFEPGRVRQDFAPKAPPDFLSDIPVDPKPVKVLQSYMESMTETENGTSAHHIQTTYVYITKQDLSTIMDRLKKYLEKNGFKITSSETTGNQPVYSLIGRSTTSSTFRSLNATISKQNQFENLVNISFMISVYVANSQFQK